MGTRGEGDRKAAALFASGWLPAALIVLATAAAYANSLRGPFIYDDLNDIVGNASIRRLWPLRGVFVVHAAGETALQARPLVILSLAVNHAMGGLETLPYHLTNLAVHLLAALTLFGIVRRTLRLPGLAERFGQAGASLALTVALIWALHPLQTHAVTYVIQRYESMMGFFFLLALYGLIRAGTSPRGRAWEAASVAATLASAACKEVAVAAPLCLLLYDRAFLAGSFRAALGRRRWMYGGLIGVWAALAALLASSRSRSTWAGFDLAVTWGDYARTQFGVILHYLGLSIWPHPLVLDYGWPVARSLGEALPGAVVVGAAAAATAVALVRRPKWGFVGAWFFLILAPSSSILPLTDRAATYRMYLPLAAIVVAVVLGLHLCAEALVRRGWLPARTAVAIGLCAASALSVSLAAATWVRNRDFRSEISIWEDTVAKAPHNPRARNNLGVVLASAGRTDEALPHFRIVLSLKPDHAKAHFNLGLALAARGQAGDAFAHYRMALDLATRQGDRAFAEQVRGALATPAPGVPPGR